MGERILAIIVAATLALMLAFHAPGSHAEVKPDAKTTTKSAPVPWKKIPESERRVLVPLEKDWAQLPATQQRRLVGAAKKYPTLVPIQQERFQERIKEWSALTPAQRHSARDKYKDLSNLPPAKQYELREKWQERATQARDPAKASPDSPAK